MRRERVRSCKVLQAACGGSCLVPGSSLTLRGEYSRVIRLAWVLCPAQVDRQAAGSVTPRKGRGREVCHQLPRLLHPLGSVTLGEWLNESEAQLPHLQNLPKGTGGITESRPHGR